MLPRLPDGDPAGGGDATDVEDGSPSASGVLGTRLSAIRSMLCVATSQDADPADCRRGASFGGKQALACSRTISGVGRAVGWQGWHLHQIRRLQGGVGLADGRGGEFVGISQRQLQQDPVVQRDHRKGVEVDRSLPGRHARFADRLGHAHRVPQRAGVAQQAERLQRPVCRGPE